MMILPDPGVLNTMIRDRQTHLQARPHRSAARARSAIRVRLGRALIAAGANLSGERAEQPTRPSALSRAI